ncbi:hypothetical protein QR680_008661 [Steinernema hermaphroditum]|uniref:Uncharacterized protein n=1 Tax=Steinernema hermaphroditum TaxID=289476 RepID=A0AA39IJC5_9BILA|nr:hypothetical protein QR680_008661 [Steinernema hermaphroditum]
MTKSQQPRRRRAARRRTSAESSDYSEDRTRVDVDVTVSVSDGESSPITFSRTFSTSGSLSSRSRATFPTSRSSYSRSRSYSNSSRTSEESSDSSDSADSAFDLSASASDVSTSEASSSNDRSESFSEDEPSREESVPSFFLPYCSATRSCRPRVSSMDFLSNCTQASSSPWRRSSSVSRESLKKACVSGRRAFPCSSEAKVEPSVATSECEPTQISLSEFTVRSLSPETTEQPSSGSSLKTEPTQDTSSFYLFDPELVDCADEENVECVIQEPASITSDLSLQVSPDGKITLWSRFYVYSAAANAEEEIELYTVQPILRHYTSTGEKSEAAKNFLQMKVGKDRLFVERVTKVSGLSGRLGDFSFSDRRKVSDICALQWHPKGKHSRFSSGELTVDGRYKIAVAADGNLSATESLYLGFDDIRPCRWNALDGFGSSATYPTTSAARAFFYDEMVLVGAEPSGISAVSRLDIFKGKAPLSGGFGLIEKREYHNEKVTATDSEFSDLSAERNPKGSFCNYEETNPDQQE